MRLHHVQILCPPGTEDAARAFYRGVLGLCEIAKPRPIAADGVWFEFDDGRQLHIGAMREGDRPGRSRAHFAIQVADIDSSVATLRAAGIEIRIPPDIPGWRRVQLTDPFGNNIELIEVTAGE